MKIYTNKTKTDRTFSTILGRNWRRKLKYSRQNIKLRLISENLYCDSEI